MLLSGNGGCILEGEKMFGIKRCPRCGSRGKVTNEHGFRVECTDEWCWYKTTMWGTKKYAVREWNERRL